jgi:hypothetical protein
MSEFRPEVRALIRAGRTALLPTVADRERVFAGLAVRLGYTPESPPPALAATKTGAGRVLSLGAAGLVVAALVTCAVLWSSKRPSVATAPVPVTPAVAPRSAAAVPVAPIAIEAPAVAPRLADSAAPRAPAKSHEKHADSLNQEVALLARAETELHAGAFAKALAPLDEHARSFPRGVLAPERIAARVHALCGLGRVAEANTELARIAPGSLQESSARDACAGVAAP